MNRLATAPSNLKKTPRTHLASRHLLKPRVKKPVRNTDYKNGILHPGEVNGREQVICDPFFLTPSPLDAKQCQFDCGDHSLMEARGR